MEVQASGATGFFLIKCNTTVIFPPEFSEIARSIGSGLAGKLKKNYCNFFAYFGFGA